MAFPGGSETKARLERGKRTQEVLKQGLHETITMEEEAMILYALTHGHLDSIAIEDLKKAVKIKENNIKEEKQLEQR